MNRLRLYLGVLTLLLCSVAPLWAADASKPAPSTIDEMSFPNGSYVGKVVFTMPTKTTDNVAISEGLTYKVYAGTSYANLNNLTNFYLVGEGSASAGEQVTIDNVDIKQWYTRENFSVTFTVFAFNSQGYSFKYSAVFVGYADPEIPSNIRTSLNEPARQITITWDAPTKPRNINQGGYIDVDNLTYTIVRYPGAKELWAYGVRYTPIEVATNITGNSFTDQLPDEPYQGYSYRIEVSNHGQTSVPYWGYTDTVKVGRPWTVPYLDTFDDSYQFNRYEKDTYREGNILYSWWSQNTVLRSQGTGSGIDSDWWLVSPPITMEAGNRYEASLMGRLSAKRTHAVLTIAVGQGDDPNTYEVVADRVNVPWIDEYTYTKVAGSYTVPATGTYRVAIHDVTDRLNNNYSFVGDSLRVDLLSAIAAPDSVTNLVVTPGAKGAISASVSFNAPTVNTAGEAIASLSKIEILRTIGNTEQVVEIIESPTPGQAITFTDNNTQAGYATYKVTVYNASGKGLDNEQTIFIGPDAPVAVTGVTLIDLLNDDQQIKLYWDPVSTVGVHGGYVDPESIDYNVYIRGENDPLTGAPTVGALQHTLKGTEVTITGVKVEEGDPSFIWYYVEAVNSLGKTDKQFSNTLVCGDPYPLPFIEDVPNGMTQYYWWYSLVRPDDYDNENGYAFGLDGYHGTGNEMGCFSWKSNNTGETGILRSCKIATKGVVHPYMEMNIRYTSATEQPIVRIRINDANQNSTVAWEYTGTMTPNDKNWTHVSADLSAFKDLPYMLVEIEIITPQSGTQFYIDNVHLYDLLDYDIETTIDNTLTHVKAGTPTVFNVHAKNLGLQSNARWTMNLYANSQLVDSKKGKQLDILEDYIIPMTYTPQTADPVNTEVYAELEWDVYDLNEDNDRSAIVDLVIEPADVNPVNDLSAVPNDDNSQVTLVWSQPTNAITVTETFDTYTAWQEPYGKWTSIDADQVVNFVPGTWTFPYMGLSYGWALFDVTDVVSPIGADMTANSGNQCAVSMSTAMNTATKTYPPSDDWLVSPLLSGNAQTIKFYIRDYSASTYASTVEVLASATGKQPGDFTRVADYPKGMIGSKWVEKSVSLPAGTKYFAIRNQTSNGFCVCVDDVTYEAGGGEVLGYNVYKDGQLLQSIDNPNTTELVVDNDGNHSYTVSVIYTEGESGMSNVATTETTAISTIGTATETVLENARYNTNGQRIVAPQRGVNIVRTNDGKTHKVVVK